MSTAHRYTDSELLAMLQDVESDLVERKESLRGDAPTSIREAVCAFANDLPGHRRPGVVFVGADDAGRPTGLPIARRELRANRQPAPAFKVTPQRLFCTVQARAT